jgi:hypothetical protein
MRRSLLRGAALTLALTLSGTASAFTIYDSFGPFPDATWGGSGIPNDAVAASRQIVDGNTTITIAMNATGRYENPPTTNNGAGVYYAQTGKNDGGPSNPTGSEGALWNWNYYISIASPDKKLTDYQIDLWYDFDPAPNTSITTDGLGRINVTSVLSVFNPTATLVEDSQNSVFGGLSVASFFVTPPETTFDPFAQGIYQFAITVTNGLFPVESVAMEVHAVPLPAAAWLFISALGGLLVIGRRRRMAA